MGVRALYDPVENRAALFDSVSETAFGPLFGWGERETDSREEPEHPIARALAFAEWVAVTHDVDIRSVDSKRLAEMYDDWSKG